ncbi:MAG: alpha-hydroxy-acid oxidizing protein [Desulfobacterium sp.]|nr:alpha-hydroxy-acid oxidizing protein [Desulfobacterium sp.]
MTDWYCTLCDTNSNLPEKPDTCPNCGADEIMILDPDQGIPATPEDVRDIARKRLKGICAAYPACDGNFDKICQKEAYGKPIGFGGAGQGAGFRANALALLNIRFKTRVVGEHAEPETRTSFLGINLDFPVMPASTAGIERYNNVVREVDFCRAVVRGASQAGTIGWRGDTWFYTPEENPALQALKQEKGYGIPIFKPRAQDVLKRLISMAEETGCPAVGIDLDGCGSTIMAKHGQPVFRKSAAEIRELVEFSSLPFIAKGIMDPDDAEGCAEAGVKVVSVSNHGGRVLDSVPGTAEVLPLIVDRLDKRVLITADGGVRTGYDVLKMLALGADAVLLGRDIIRAAVGGGSLGVKIHLDHIHKILKKALFMTGLKNVKDADGKILFP